MNTPFDDLYSLEDKLKFIDFLEFDLNAENYGQYFSLLQECANEGNEDSVLRISSIYRYGDEFTESDESAALQTLKVFFSKYKKGAIAKEIADIYWLALDDSEADATEWYKVAADLGEPESCRDLARRYQYGWGCDQSIENAIRYYELAIGYKNTRANLELAELYLNNTESSDKQKLAIKLLQDGAIQEDDDCQLVYATYLESGQYVTQDLNQAFMWLSKSAAHGNEEAQYKLGNKYLIGIGIEKDSFAAVGWFEKSANNHFQKAQVQLYTAYLTGSGVEKNLTLAFAWLLIARRNTRPQSSEELKSILATMSHLLAATLNINQIEKAKNFRDSFIKNSSYFYEK